MDHELNIGDSVTGFYKTGQYIGIITDVRPRHYLVKTLAVLKHPEQGDLHNPHEIDVPLFHERKALSKGEQANMLKQQVRRYEATIPTYEDSLRKAIKKKIESLQKDETAWAQQSIKNLKQLQSEYFNK
ncbi:kinase-associated lipoprotein B [Bacillus solimangrovi]|uniref:Kinase n=1 Tax=Bacillus solimangrovi TaxID=1305675 RepID=A0A1E5LIV9_9BACI|nr:kinase-associated lipoprotein B [Bacillus solimangrovi]OEH94020.1 kinase [Bacillus solimangrovi]